MYHICNVVRVDLAAICKLSSFSDFCTMLYHTCSCSCMHASDVFCYLVYIVISCIYRDILYISCYREYEVMM